jgi:hypothetical protein
MQKEDQIRPEMDIGVDPFFKIILATPNLQTPPFTFR